MAKSFIKTKHHLLCLTVPPVRGKPRFNKSSSKIKTPQKSNCFSSEKSSFLPSISFKINFHILQFSSVQSLSRVQLFATPWIAARQASLSITNSQSLLKPMSIELVMPSSHLILCRPVLLLPTIRIYPPTIRIFSNESTLHIRWKYWPSHKAKVLEFQLQHQSFQWTPRTDLL